MSGSRSNFIETKFHIYPEQIFILKLCKFKMINPFRSVTPLVKDKRLWRGYISFFSPIIFSNFHVQLVSLKPSFLYNGLLTNKAVLHNELSNYSVYRNKWTLCYSGKKIFFSSFYFFSEKNPLFLNLFSIIIII